ncbi:CDP-Ethanolamine:DAG ethanolamine phosphotransferase [Micractinium conductrix]|uniref:CDP-Ethanolamine:DAG ethanolamine phosphotransferase n=1 Tax=Micractinium conductrix TaxID=554055 RepID=A0A2P6VM22_9CHLO|nr:CDP-Ethanolamine:DAG ethanolamine phosphotransferase [Micractinium conductrix]|eukprot:PSC75152.1 CDP-Ethanolamine:DAG ethanolamine phosphotransferase [Micractinium conductrix]
MPYLTKRALEGLRDYAYKPSGYTYLDELHQPIWNYITNNWLPLWLAPNLITLIGVSALVMAYVAAAVQLPDFAGSAPLWVYAGSAFATFFYLHMDCLDGKQARRTRNSSPLGQLFDHGCDALAVHLVLTNVACSLNLAMGWRPIAAAFIIMVPWVLAHWEEYHTGIMVYGNGAFGVTEANYSVVLLHLFTWAIRPQSWLIRPFASLVALPSVAAVLPRPVAALLAALQLNELVSITICSMAAQLACQQITRVVRLAGSKQLEHTTLPKAEHGNKQLGRAAAMAHLAQLAALFMMGWALLSLPATAPWQARVHNATFGVIYALQATRLIMAHMSKEPFSIALWTIAAMAAQILNHMFGWVDPLTCAYAVNAVVVVGYLHYVICMVREICAFLKIPCLTPSSDLGCPHTMAAKLKRCVRTYNSIEDFVEGEEWQEAVEALENVTSQVSGDPRGFDLTGDGERWEAAGGDEISEAGEFATVLYDKWVDVLGQAAENLEWEPAQWENLWKDLQKWGRALARAGLDFGGDTGMAELQDIIETYASGAPKQRKRKAPVEEAPADEAGDEAAAPAAAPEAKKAKEAEEEEEEDDDA